jgi:hypothetical protein
VGQPTDLTKSVTEIESQKRTKGFLIDHLQKKCIEFVKMSDHYATSCMRLFQNPRVRNNFELWLKVGGAEERKQAKRKEWTMAAGQIDKIWECKKKGLSNRDIAVEVGCHPNTVAKYLKRKRL